MQDSQGQNHSAQCPPGAQKGLLSFIGKSLVNTKTFCELFFVCFNSRVIIYGARSPQGEPPAPGLPSQIAWLATPPALSDVCPVAERHLQAQCPSERWLCPGFDCLSILSKNNLRQRQQDLLRSLARGLRATTEAGPAGVPV